MVVLISCSRLFHNFGAANIKARLPRVFDDFVGRKRSKVPSDSNCEDCNVKVSQQKEEKKDKMEPYYLKS